MNRDYQINKEIKRQKDLETWGNISESILTQALTEEIVGFWEKINKNANGKASAEAIHIFMVQECGYTNLTVQEVHQMMNEVNPNANGEVDLNDFSSIVANEKIKDMQEAQI
jgi:Ca2+-binding EF-hand superfamily protein